MIPKILHQVWVDKGLSLPESFLKLSQTWKNLHSDWEYKCWTEKDLYDFMETYYPQYIEVFDSFPYDVQRWDVVRYLIMYQMGGLYVDFDYECVENIEPLLKADCCFASEATGHIAPIFSGKWFNNSLIASVPKTPFLQQAITRIFSEERLRSGAKDITFMETGPFMLMLLYQEYPHKEEVYLIPAENVSPLSRVDVADLWNDMPKEGMEEKLKDAYAIHYYVGTWMDQLKD